MAPPTTPGPPAVPPRAPRRPTVLAHDGDERVDDWYWLRDRDDPEVLAYLTAENEHTEAALTHLDPLRERLFDEIRGRVQETDTSAPVPWGRFEYLTRTVAGLQYEVHARRPAGTGGGAEEVLLDENVLAEGHGYFALGGFAVSPDHRLLAYSTDVTGGERYELRFRDLDAAVDLPDVVPNTSYGLAWFDDARTILYVRPDAAMRPWQVWSHELGTPPSADRLVLQEDDEHFFVSVERARSGRVLLVESASKTTAEVWLVDAAAPSAPPRVVAPREVGVEYAVEHHATGAGDRLFVVTNRDGAQDFALFEAPAATPGPEHWREVVPHRPGVRLEHVDAFTGHLVLSERADGLTRLRVLRFADGDVHTVELPEPVGTVWVGANLEPDTATLRFGYTSLVTPRSAYDHGMDDRSRTLVKQDPVLGGYDPADYETSRLWATAPDGERVPVSVVHRRGLALDGSAPCLLYGYGSYEHAIDPSFSPSRLSLLERGVVFAVAHVRGGGEMGRRWYEDGRLAHKTHTFTDFVACAEHLVAEGYTSPERLAARGRSAGGLLMGAVANLRPDLFRAVVAEVPFVDCLTTMLDETIPLTVTEWEEWGDPVTDPHAYALMRSYSPYDNVEAKDYPAMFVTGGLHDPRVQFWEPAKWVAKLRATKTDDRCLVLKTEMGAGHAGPSGRYDAWRDEALVLAFLLDQLGVGQPG